MLAQGGWALGARFVTLTGGLALAALLTRMLGPEQVGQFFVLLNTAGLMAIVGSLGLEELTLQYTSRAHASGTLSQVRRDIRTILKLQSLMLVVVAAAVVFAVVPWLNRSVFSSPVASSTVIAMVVWTIVLTYQRTLGEVFRGRHDIKSAVLFGGKQLLSGALTVVLAIGLLLVLWMLALPPSLGLVLGTVALAGFLTVTLAWRQIRGFLAGPVEKQSSSDGVRRLLPASFPLLIHGMSQFAIKRVDIWIAGVFLAEAEVGVYAATAILAAVVGVSLSIVNEFLPPAIGLLQHQGEGQRLEGLLRRAASYTTFVGVILVIVFLLFGRFLLSVAFGPAYAAGSSVLIILAAGQLVGLWVGTCGYTLIMAGHQRDLMVLSIVGAVLATVGGIFSVQAWGLIGLATTTSLALAVHEILKMLVCKRRCGVWSCGKFVLPDVIAGLSSFRRGRMAP